MNTRAPWLVIALVFLGNTMEGMEINNTKFEDMTRFSEGYLAFRAGYEEQYKLAPSHLPPFDQCTPEMIRSACVIGQPTLLPKPNGNVPRNVSLSSGDHSGNFTQLKKSFPFSRTQIATSTGAFLATLELGIAIGELQKEDAFSKNRFYKYPWLIAARTATNIGSRPIQLCKAIKSIFHRG
jgi:hypothetical protein